MTIWTFHQSGSIPGVPGTFAGVSVDVDDATNKIRSITPLAVHSDFVAALEEEAPVVNDQARSKTTKSVSSVTLADTVPDKAQP